MKRIPVFFLLVLLLGPFRTHASETVSVVYQNDIHGWMFPSSTRPGMDGTARYLESVFAGEPSSFYAVSGDLLTGPDLPKAMKGAAEQDIWNRFVRRLGEKGYDRRVVISAGNHEFDYGVPAPGAFSGGLLCANVTDPAGEPYFPAVRIVETEEGLRVGFVGLLLEENARVNRTLEKRRLRVSSKRKAVERFLPRMGRLDLTVLMIHDTMERIAELVGALDPAMGVDVVLSGHDHLVLEQPVYVKGVPVLQAGAVNAVYGLARLTIEQGRVLSLSNRIISRRSSVLERAQMRVKEMVDERKGKSVAILESSLKGVTRRGAENSLGDFVADAFRWATGADVAMTNSGSLRYDIDVSPGETFQLREGDLRSLTPFRNRLVVGEVTGAQILQILEGEAAAMRNQVSGLRYVVDTRNPPGERVVRAWVGGEPLRREATYTLAHNAYCARPEKMETCLHLKPGAVDWKTTDLVDSEVMAAFARKVGRIRYPEGGEGRIVRLP